MGYMENCLYQISFCQWVADENMYTIVMYDRDWKNQALDGTGDIIPFHWRRPTLWEVLLVIWCERQDAVHVAVDIDNCQARNSDTPLLEIDFTGMTTVVFRECDIYGPEVQTLVAGGSVKRGLHTSVVDLRGDSRQIAVK